MTGKHGNHRRGTKVPRIPITCPVCGTVREFTESFLRIHPSTTYCSRTCMGKAKSKQVTITCEHCGKETQRRHDQVEKGKARYCSKECAVASRRDPKAKWNDPKQIAAYMKGYVQANKDRHNERSREWAKANRASRKATAQKRKAAGKGLGHHGRLRQQMIEIYGSACLCCGTTERIEIDHIIPIARGGSDDITNIQPLCRSCNAVKSATTVDYRQTYPSQITTFNV